jgi:hypothetical protein
VKTGCNLAESSKEGYGSKWAVLPMMMMMMMMIVGRVPFSEQQFSRYQTNISIKSGITYPRSSSKGLKLVLYCSVF